MHKVLPLSQLRKAIEGRERERERERERVVQPKEEQVESAKEEEKNMTRGCDKKLSASVFSCLVLIYI